MARVKDMSLVGAGTWFFWGAFAVLVGVAALLWMKAPERSGKPVVEAGDASMVSTRGPVATLANPSRSMPAEPKAEKESMDGPEPTADSMSEAMAGREAAKADQGEGDAGETDHGEADRGMDAEADGGGERALVSRVRPGEGDDSSDPASVAEKAGAGQAPPDTEDAALALPNVEAATRLLESSPPESSLEKPSPTKPSEEEAISATQSAGVAQPGGMAPKPGGMAPKPGGMAQGPTGYGASPIGERMWPRRAFYPYHPNQTPNYLTPNHPMPNYPARAPYAPYMHYPPPPSTR